MNSSALVRLSLLFSSLAALAVGQVTFTATGVYDLADNAYLGLTQNSTYTFIFTLSPSVSNNGSSFFTNSIYYWAETSPNHTAIWSDVTSTALTGTYAPTATPSNAIYLTSGAGLQISAYDDSSLHSIGFTAGSGIRGITIKASTLTGIWSFSGSYENPSAYFANYSNTYQIDPVYSPTTSNGILLSFSEGGSISLRLQDITISNAPTTVPEASTIALLGLGALGLLARHWHRRSRATTLTP